MSIANKISLLQQAKSAIADAITAKGVSTTGHGLSDFATDIASIPSGGGGDTTALENLLLRCFTARSEQAQNDLIIDLRSIGNITLYNLREYAFAYLRAKELYLPPTQLKTLPSYVCAQSKIPKIVLQSDTETLGTYCFQGATINTFDIPVGVTQIPSSTFNGCSSLESVTMGSVTSIGQDAFRACSVLALTALPNTVASVGNYAFYSSGLALTALPSSLTTIGNNAFASCTALVLTEIPSTVQSVGSNAFSGCTGLTLLHICAKVLGVSTSSTKPFNGCTGLTKVWISSDVITMFSGSSANGIFAGCTNLTDIYCEPASKPSGWGVYWHYINASTQATVHWGVSRAEFDALP